MEWGGHETNLMQQFFKRNGMEMEQIYDFFKIILVF